MPHDLESNHALSVSHLRGSLVPPPHYRRLDDDQSGHSSLTLGFLWNVVRRWGKIAIPLGIVMMLLATGIVFYLFEPVYRAEALLQIKKQRPMVAVKIDDSGSTEFVETQKHLLKSAPVLNKVVAHPQVSRMAEAKRKYPDDSRRWIEEQLEVKAVGRSDLFTVAFQGPDAENARIIVDAVVQAYFSIQSSQSDDQITDLLEVLRREKDVQLEKVSRLEKLLQETAKRYSGDAAVIVDPTGRGVFEINPALRALEQQLTQSEFERQLIQAQLKAFEGQLEPPLPGEADLTQAIAASPSVSAWEAKIDELRKELIVLQPKSDIAKAVAQKIQEYEINLQEARRTERERLVKQNNEQLKAAQKDRMSQAHALVREYQIREETVRARLDEERRKLEGKAGGQFELEFLRNDLARAKDVANRIEDRIFALSVEFLSPQRPEQVLVIHPAEAAKTPVQLYPLKHLALASMGGLFLPLLIFGAFELFSRRLYQSDQLQGGTQLALVGEIAALPARPLLAHRRAERRFLRDRAVFEESVESLRSFLSVSPEWAELQVLGVTSAVAREGKTSLASQLATGWSRNERSRTLIIDGDVRSPDLQRVFSLPESPGLVEVLAGTCELDGAIVNWEENLDVLPAGTLVSSPHGVFAGSRFREVMDQLRSRYARVILDVAPLLSASEVLPMLKAVDGVLLCARKDHSRGPQVRLALERLEKAGIKRVGGVFGGISSHSYAYQFGEYLG
jgi:succinoglycan biosynthesis transport protein ExoP